jgi:riboflavin kinase/FMN adenylyltransferase
VNVLRNVDDLPRDLRFVLTIGMFDGVHRGHQRAIATLLRSARQLNGQSVVMTFDPHPAQVLRGSAPDLLCSPAEKLARIAALGVETIVVQPFDKDFAGQTPERFIDRLTHNRQLVGLVMTAESAFGRDRSGMLPVVRGLGRERGFKVVEVARLNVEGGTLSSTRLRRLVGDGRLADARRLLGRDYAVTGTVVRGDQRGRDLGYPTANLTFDAPVTLPRDGIYAVRAAWGGEDPLAPARTADGVASLGVRPTFESGGARILEVHLFDVDEDLYGHRLRVEFVRRLRGEKKFKSVEALVKQMDRDTTRARNLLRNRTTAASDDRHPAMPGGRTLSRAAGAEKASAEETVRLAAK